MPVTVDEDIVDGAIPTRVKRARKDHRSAGFPGSVPSQRRLVAAALQVEDQSHLIPLAATQRCDEFLAVSIDTKEFRAGPEELHRRRGARAVTEVESPSALRFSAATGRNLTAPEIKSRVESRCLIALPGRGKALTKAVVGRTARHVNA